MNEFGEETNTHILLLLNIGSSCCVTFTDYVHLKKIKVRVKTLVANVVPNRKKEHNWKGN